MANPDGQILAAGTAVAPLTYVTPGAVVFRLKAVNAEFDGSGASGDYLPSVVLISDGGHVIARAVDQGVTITAGSDAEVSWFPGVKGSNTLPLLQSEPLFLQDPFGLPLTPGAPQALDFTVWEGPLTPYSCFDWAQGLPIVINGVAAPRAYVDFTVQFSAGSSNGYIAITQSGAGQPFGDITTSTRGTGGTGEELSVGCVVGGDRGVPQPIQFIVAFDAASPQALQAYVRAYQWPQIAGQSGWPG